MKINASEVLRRVVAEHREYRSDAYNYIYDLTTSSDGNRPDSLQSQKGKHMTAKELYNAFCHQALEEYGPMASTVLGMWGLRTTRDVARATYHLIHAGLISKQRDESINDFLSLPPLEDMLENPFKPRQ